MSPLQSVGMLYALCYKHINSGCCFVAAVESLIKRGALLQEARLFWQAVV